MDPDPVDDVPVNTFEHQCLSGARFADVNLSQAVFDDVDLQGARFDNVALTGARFRNACLGAVSIDDCKLEGLRINGLLVTDLLALFERTRPSTN
jgi:uncharacterized protein YjbI with pentapeptide repeats